MGALTRFLGDSPVRTLVKLAIISFVVGIIMSALNFTPYDLWLAVQRFAERLYNLGFEAIWSVLRYFFWGAAVVVPIFLLSRVLKLGR